MMKRVKVLEDEEKKVAELHSIINRLLSAPERWAILEKKRQEFFPTRKQVSAFQAAKCR